MDKKELQRDILSACELIQGLRIKDYGPGEALSHLGWKKLANAEIHLNHKLEKLVFGE